MIRMSVENLYMSHWGEPSRRAEFYVAESPMAILKWNAEDNPEGVALYATAGMSDASMRGHNPKHRLELFCGLLPEQDDVARPLAMLATYPAREDTALDHGDTVRLVDPLWESTDMLAFLVVRPLSGILPTLELADGVHVEFMQALPLFESELTFKSQHGAEALLRHWEEARVPFWDPRRSPEPP